MLAEVDYSRINKLSEYVGELDIPEWLGSQMIDDWGIDKLVLQDIVMHYGDEMTCKIGKWYNDYHKGFEFKGWLTYSTTDVEITHKILIRLEQASKQKAEKEIEEQECEALQKRIELHIQTKLSN